MLQSHLLSTSYPFHFHLPEKCYKEPYVCWKGRYSSNNNTLCTKWAVYKARSGFTSDPAVLWGRAQCPPWAFSGPSSWCTCRHVELIFPLYSRQLLLCRSLLQLPHIGFFFFAPSKSGETWYHPLQSPPVPMQRDVQPKALGTPTAGTKAGSRASRWPCVPAAMLKQTTCMYGKASTGHLLHLLCGQTYQPPRLRNW